MRPKATVSASEMATTPTSTKLRIIIWVFVNANVLLYSGNECKKKTLRFMKDGIVRDMISMILNITNG